jgi:hypothetical protein
MKKVDIKPEETLNIDDLIQIITKDEKGNSSSFTAAVVSDSLDRLFPKESDLSQLLLVSSLRNDQIVHVLKALYAPCLLGLNEEKMEHPSVYEFRLQIIESFARSRVSINGRGRNDIVKSLSAIMLNELQRGASKISNYFNKGV